MEKTTKKKKSKRLKRRIGLIAVGGLSLVLTVCLSVGATLAWFAGTTWASNDLYMGGPVYVEMAGRGHSGSTNGTGDNEGKWVGGNGTLDIVASSRNTGTSSGQSANSVLLPGQKLLVYSQARVYSTAYENNLEAGMYPNQSAGGNTTNTAGDKENAGNRVQYVNNKGTVKTTTTSVLRAQFSIDVQFDPSVGFNNFTNEEYANNYPEQSKPYTGEKTAGAISGTTAKSWTYTSSTSESWDGALIESDETATRRDNIVASDTTHDSHAGSSKKAQDWVAGYGETEDNTDELWDIKNGYSKSIYKWKYVDSQLYNNASNATHMKKMGAPFNGAFNSAGGKSNQDGGTGNGYYGVWLLGDDNKPLESDAFYKARCDAYLKSYVEHIVTKDQVDLLLTIKNLGELEEALNNSFAQLVHESSDNIIGGNVRGFNADENGLITFQSGGSATSASWLYVDPSIGNDTNAGDSATSLGGWWYLVACDLNGVEAGTNQVKTELDNVVDSSGQDMTDVVTYSGGTPTFNFASATNEAGAKSSPKAGDNFVREPDGVFNKMHEYSGYTGSLQKYDSKNKNILTAKLFEITPDQEINEVVSTTNGTRTTKIVSVSFPFVNGQFELPGKELTNVFANAKISFKITFQSLQAFFPYTTSIDGCRAGSALAGTGKALNIYNAIPIFNEAFDYLSYLDTAL